MRYQTFACRELHLHLESAHPSLFLLGRIDIRKNYSMIRKFPLACIRLIR
jgi:hypothetical protein